MNSVDMVEICVRKIHMKKMTLKQTQSTKISINTWMRDGKYIEKYENKKKLKDIDENDLKSNRILSI